MTKGPLKLISFSRLGSYGRLGNQLFQYAFLRNTAESLGVPFYCPPWDGDDIFDLNDSEIRAIAPEGIGITFDSHPEAGYTSAALNILDGTEIKGYFQSERYFSDKMKVRSWYRFKSPIVESVTKAFDMVHVESSVSFSVRLDGDYGNTREFFPLYPLAYYRRAYEFLGGRGTIYVFADRPDLAKVFFSPMKGLDIRFVEGLSAAQQLYLMTRFRANVITNSTFSWWGAWLNKNIPGKVVAATEWCRAGVPRDISDIICADWFVLPATTPVWDHFQVWRLRHPISTARRFLSRLPDVR